MKQLMPATYMFGIKKLEDKRNNNIQKIDWKISLISFSATIDLIYKEMIQKW